MVVSNNSKPAGGKPPRKSRKASFDKLDAQIIAGLDVIAEYEQLGAVFVADKPRANGFIECYARGREESKPSATVATFTGRYLDSGGGGENLSLFDFAAKYAPERFNNWRAARAHYAEKAKVQLPSSSKSGGKSSKYENPIDALEFLPWTEQRKHLAELWGIIHKPGCSFAAIHAAGGMVARYKCYKDPKTGNRVIGRQTVIALPCYGEQLTAAAPVAWVIWDISGGRLEIRQKNRDPFWVKMKSVGPTAGAIMNKHSCDVLREYKERAANGALACGVAENPIANSNGHGALPFPASPLVFPPIAFIHKTAGPTDMLALMSQLDPSQRRTHLVIANASGESGEPPKWIGDLLAVAGLREAKFIVTHDADRTGEAGVLKWLAAVGGKAAGGVVQVRLPYEVRDKGGADLRQWFNERRKARA